MSLALGCRFPSAKVQKSDSDLDIKQLVEQIILGELFCFRDCFSDVCIEGRFVHAATYTLHVMSV